MTTSQPDDARLQEHILATLLTTAAQILVVAFTMQMILAATVIVLAVVDRDRLTNPTIFVTIYVLAAVILALIIAIYVLSNYELLQYIGWKKSVRHLRLSIEYRFIRQLTSRFLAYWDVPDYLKFRSTALWMLHAWQHRVSTLRRLFALSKPYLRDKAAGNKNALAHLDRVESEIEQIAQEQLEMRAKLQSLPPVTLKARFQAMVDSLRIIDQGIVPPFRPRHR